MQSARDLIRMELCSESEENLVQFIFLTDFDGKMLPDEHSLQIISDEGKFFPRHRFWLRPSLAVRSCDLEPSLFA